MKQWLKTYWQYLLNVILFVVFLDIAVHQVALKVLAYDQPLHVWYQLSIEHFVKSFETIFSDSDVAGVATGSRLSWYALYCDSHWLTQADWSRMALADWSFAGQTMLMITLVLLRVKHAAVNRNPWHQCVALFAFCSGILFIGEKTVTAGPGLVASTIIIFSANVLAVASLLHLGRSFGILIALRRVKTGGVYSVIRHPMYASDILLRIGFVISHPSLFTAGLFVSSVAAYGYRAILEERFLEQDVEYRQYKAQVRYRFIPGLV